MEKNNHVDISNSQKANQIFYSGPNEIELGLDHEETIVPGK